MTTDGIGFEPDKPMDVDLGDGHGLTWFGYRDISRAGAHVWHRTPTGNSCCGSVNFDVPGVTGVLKGAVWQVESRDPLTLSPSLLCSCGDHGFIRAGRWVRA